MIFKVGIYQGSTLFITFKSQSAGSPFKATSAPETVCNILNQAATSAWATHGTEPWQHVCEFPVQMSRSKETKKAMLFYNSTMQDVKVEWIEDYIKRQKITTKGAVHA